MNKDRIEGSFDQAKGKVKEVAGKVTGDTKLETEGKADQVKGKVQNTVGGMKDSVKEADRIIRSNRSDVRQNPALPRAGFSRLRALRPLCHFASLGQPTSAITGKWSEIARASRSTKLRTSVAARPAIDAVEPQQRKFRRKGAEAACARRARGSAPRAPSPANTSR